MTTIREISVVVDADTTRLKTGLASAQSSVTGFSRGGSSALGVLKAAATGAAIFGIAKLGTAAVSTAADFDTSFRTMTAIADVHGRKLQQLQDLAIEQGKATVFSANDSADAMLELAKAGVSVADIQGGALANTLSLATAGSLELTDAATIAANAMNTFKLRGSESQQAVDALAGAANASSADVADLAMGLAQGGQAAHVAGLSIQDTTAVLAAFSNAGLKGSDAGTSMKTFLLSLVPTTEKAQTAMKKLGLSFTDAQGNIKPIGDIAQSLQDKLGGLSQAEQQTALKTIFGTDAFRAAAILMDEGAGGLAKYTKATSEQGTAAKVGEARMAGFAGKMESLKGSLETLALIAGQALLPALSDIADAAVPLLNNFAPVIATFAKFAGTVLVGLLKVLTFLMPVLPAIAAGLATFFIIQKIISMVKALQIAFQVLTATNPFLLIAAAVVIVAVLIITHWKTIKAYLLRVWAALKAGFTIVWNAIKGVAIAVFNFLKGAVLAYLHVYVAAWNVVKSAALAVWHGIQGGANAVWSFLKRVASWVSGVFSRVWDGVKRVAVGIWDGILSAARSALNGLISIWNSTIGAIAHGQSINAGPLHVTLPDLRITPLAAGALIRAGGGGILANIGEGHNDEAVVPMRPSVLRHIGKAIADAGGGGGHGQRVAGEVSISPDGRAWFEGVVVDVLDSPAFDRALSRRVRRRAS